jgi:hypothetical protein
MALLTATNPAATGTLAAPAAMTVSDTISGNLVGGYLKVYNGAGAPINVTIADPGTTAMGNTATNAAIAVTNATAKWILLTAGMVDSATNLITVTLSSATSITYELLP